MCFENNISEIKLDSFSDGWFKELLRYVVFIGLLIALLALGVATVLLLPYLLVRMGWERIRGKNMDVYVGF